jgi:RNA polymerase sigma-70 factor, ECF subfamily
LVRLLTDFDLAEEARHEAFAAAILQWPNQGLPATLFHGLSRPGDSRLLRKRLSEVSGQSLTQAALRSFHSSQRFLTTLNYQGFTFQPT